MDLRRSLSAVGFGAVHYCLHAQEPKLAAQNIRLLAVSTDSCSVRIGPAIIEKLDAFEPEEFRTL